MNNTITKTWKIDSKKCYTRYQAGLFDPDFPQGKLFRVIFDPPITLMKDDRIEISIKVK